MIDELASALAELERDQTVASVIFTGDQRAFCVGADLVEVEAAVMAGQLFCGPGTLSAALARLLATIEHFPRPTIAAVRGWALAGGFELVQCCDFVIAGHSARLGDAHIKYGLLPTGGGSVRLPRLIGPMRAKRLMLTGEAVSAETMMEFGLVTQVVHDEEVEGRALLLADQIGAQSAQALARMKRLVNGSLELSPAEAQRREHLEADQHAPSTDLREGLAAFRGKREPRFGGG
jgi:enoyl-CoA hydratase/carnithine racemase